METNEQKHVESQHNHTLIKQEQKNPSKMVSNMQDIRIWNERQKAHYSSLTPCYLSIDCRLTQKMPLRGEVNYKAGKEKSWLG